MPRLEKMKIDANTPHTDGDDKTHKSLCTAYRKTARDGINQMGYACGISLPSRQCGSSYYE